MSFLKKTTRTARQFYICFVLSFFLHSFLVAGLFIFSAPRDSYVKKEVSVIQATFIEVPKLQGKEISGTVRKSSDGFSSVKSTKEKKHAIFVSSVSFTPAKSATHLSRESLKKDMQYVAENIAFGDYEDNAFSRSEVFSSAYRQYVDACREKLMVVGNSSNKADENGEVSMHIVIGKNGDAIARYADSSVSLNLKNAAIQIIDDASPFHPFPRDFLQEIIKITIPFHFITD
ncbi:MAG: hypothetical protein NTZ13_03890 [Candidatus Parcubacteria bacterium]|nr:hypothetical protein [Candidatus Parcubacteria bacterium]